METVIVDLAVVIPVYNEEKNIKDCIESWTQVLSDLQIQYLIIILNDGSWDNTERVLSGIPQRQSIRVIHKRNEGHGPTILNGYVLASEIAQWVFQADSDNEIPPTAFHTFWNSRHGQDAILGYRIGRKQSFVRRVISQTAKSATRILYNSRLKDVNIPYRLIRSNVLAPIISRIPQNTFAPNVVISGALAKTGAAVMELPVPFQPRMHGVASLNDISAFTHAVRSLFQITRISRSFT